MKKKKTPELMKAKEYIKAFTGKSRDTKDKENVDTKWEKALDFAVKTREFEIELYWKRSNMFMLMNGAAFVGFYTVAAGEHFKENRLYALIILLLGFTFALAWHLICRGSLFWQENWEAHIDALEEPVMGHIYRYIHFKGESKYHHCSPLKSYPYSVSKIMALTSFLVIVFWFITFILSFSDLFPCAVLEFLNKDICIIVAALVALIIALYIYLCKSGFMNEFLDNTDEGENLKAEFIERENRVISETIYRSQKAQPEEKTI